MKSKGMNHMKVGEQASIQEVRGPSALALRLQELGFVPGTAVQLVAKAAFGGAMAYRVRGSIVALRRADAACVEV